MKSHVESVSAIVTIPQAAHSMNRENPEAFNAAALSFLAVGESGDRDVLSV
jgi:pimeloyl-ACP methyl ester carboxylesterase